MNKNIKGKTVFITGASAGIGEACAQQFAAAGANLILCARRAERLKKLAQELQAEYSVKAYPLVLDIADKSAVLKTFQELPAEWQEIAILINNAGTARGSESIQEGVLDDWETMIDINLKGLLYVTRQILPGMVARNYGHVINVGSIAGHEIFPGGVVYAGTKHAVNAITRGARLDLCGTKVRITTVDPGRVETEFSLVRFAGDTKKAKDFYVGMTSLTGADVADAILYCASCPQHVNISELIIMPTDQASITMINRQGVTK